MILIKSYCGQAIDERLLYMPDAPVWCQNSADRLSGPPIVVVQNPSQPFTALNIATPVGRAALVIDQFVSDPLMIALNVAMLGVFHHGLAYLA
jgi:hypothetical protein